MYSNKSPVKPFLNFNREYCFQGVGFYAEATNTISRKDEFAVA